MKRDIIYLFCYFDNIPQSNIVKSLCSSKKGLGTSYLYECCKAWLLSKLKCVLP